MGIESRDIALRATHGNVVSLATTEQTWEVCELAIAENYLRTSVNCYCNLLLHYVTSRSITTFAPQIVSVGVAIILNRKSRGENFFGMDR